jgi:hypothetical protein
LQEGKRRNRSLRGDSGKNRRRRRCWYAVSSEEEEEEEQRMDNAIVRMAKEQLGDKWDEEKYGYFFEVDDLMRTT